MSSAFIYITQETEATREYCRKKLSYKAISYFSGCDYKWSFSWLRLGLFFFTKYVYSKFHAQISVMQMLNALNIVK